MKYTVKIWEGKTSSVYRCVSVLMMAKMPKQKPINTIIMSKEITEFYLYRIEAMELKIKELEIENNLLDDAESYQSYLNDNLQFENNKLKNLLSKATDLLVEHQTNTKES